MYSQKDMIKEIRKTAKEVGLTFKKSKTCNFWIFTDRTSGSTVLSNYTLDSAYCDCMSGFIGSYDTNACEFKGVNIYYKH